MNPKYLRGSEQTLAIRAQRGSNEIRAPAAYAIANFRDLITIIASSRSLQLNRAFVARPPRLTLLAWGLVVPQGSNHHGFELRIELFPHSPSSRPALPAIAEKDVGSNRIRAHTESSNRVQFPLLSDRERMTCPEKMLVHRSRAPDR